MASIVEKCLAVIDGSEKEFITSLLGINGTWAPCCSDLDMLIASFAKCYPQEFIKAVGAYLYDSVEVA